MLSADLTFCRTWSISLRFGGGGLGGGLGGGEGVGGGLWVGAL